MRAKANKTPMCSVSLIAIELKGLAAPSEALKIFFIPEAPCGAALSLYLGNSQTDQKKPESALVATFRLSMPQQMIPP